MHTLRLQSPLRLDLPSSLQRQRKNPEPDEQKDTARRKKTMKYIVLVQQHYNNNFVVQYTVSRLHITFYFALPTEYQGSSYIQYTTSVSTFRGLTTRQAFNKS